MLGRFRVVATSLVLAILLSACEGTAAIKYQSPPASAASGSWNFDGDATGGRSGRSRGHLCDEEPKA